MNNHLNRSRLKQKYTKGNQKYRENQTKKKQQQQQNIKQLPMGDKLILKKYAHLF